MNTREVPQQRLPVSAARDTAEAGFRVVFDHSPIGIVLADAGSNYTDANAAACAMLGYTREEFVGLGASDIIAEIDARNIGAAIAESGSAAGHRGVWNLRRKDGSIFSADVTANRLPDGSLLGILHDRTDREQASAYRDHLAAIVSSSSDGIVGEDIKGQVVSWNAAAQRIFGYTAEEMIGAPILLLLPGDRPPDATQRMDRLCRGEIVPPSETQRRGKDGRLLDVVIATSPIWDASGRLIGASHSVRDVSARHAHDREIVQLTRLYAALSQINLAILVSGNRDDLFDRICHIMVAQGGFRFAWIGWEEQATGQLQLLASAGAMPTAFDRSLIRTDAQPEGMWPGAIVFRTGRAYIGRDTLAEADAIPRWPGAQQPDLGAFAAIPVRLAGEVRGVLSVHSDRANVFHDKETALLNEAASHLSFALDNHEREAARLRADEKLRSEMLFSDTIIESLPGILYFYDAEGRFLRWNRNFETVSGYSAGEIASMHPLDFFAEAERSVVQARIAEVFDKGEASVEATLLSRDGTRRPYLLTGRRVEFNGLVCLVGAGIDLSERERRHRAEAADRIKSAFLATMSHELRTPLNSIIGFTGILLQEFAGPLTAEQSKQLGMVRGSARHLLALISDVLDISKIEAGQLEIAREAFDLAASIERVVAVVAPLATDRGLDLRTEMRSGLGMAFSDQRRFEQVLLNLLSNAIKFTDRGEVTLHARRLETNPPSIRVEVADTGIGIRPEDVETLFQPFRQLDSGMARRSEGTGLGLAICRRLCALMGGAIDVEGEWGRGTVFRVTLPLQAPAPPARP